MPDQPHHLISPNLHAILIHYPLGLIIVGVLIELFSFLWRRSGFRAAGRWMILIGVASAIPAVTSGMYALYDVMGDQMDATRKDMIANAPLNEHQWHLIRDHIKLNAIAAGVMAIAVVVWIGGSDRWRHRLHWPILLVLIAGVGTMIAGAYHGGEMVYSQGVAVRVTEPSLSNPAQNKEGEHAHGQENQPKTQLGKILHSVKKPVERVADMVDVHVISAGWTVALALLTLGLSMRAASAPRLARVTTVESGTTTEDEINRAFASSPAEAERIRTAAERRGVLIETTDEPTDDRPVVEVPAPRFWLVTALLGLLTAIGGLILIEPSTFNDVITMIKSNSRYVAHTSAGVGIVVLTLVLAIVTRTAPRSRGLLVIFAALLVLAIAAQVWFGTLLLYDSPSGPIMRFNP